MMELSAEKKKIYIRRLMIARMSILSRNGFYGLLLMHMGFALDENVKTAATDGMKIYFAPSFLDEINDRELIFVLQHEVLHVALKHVARMGTRDVEVFNIACDIVVNSNILYSENMDLSAISLPGLGALMHTAPDGCEGYKYTTEEVYEMLIEHGAGTGRMGPFDEHDRWDTASGEQDALWNVWIRDAYEAAKHRGTEMSSELERTISDMFRSHVDWRQVLNEFVQEELTDYTFSPPDRRFQDTEFFLPDFNDFDVLVKKVLFWIDTSYSMSDDEVSQAYNEIRGAIEQFDGKLEGWLGFFDTRIHPPVPFTSEEEFMRIRPKGGGGTDFGIIFSYINENMADDEIASIIILTDGECDFPDQSEARGTPVLWVLNNRSVTPPWGRIVVIE